MSTITPVDPLRGMLPHERVEMMLAQLEQLPSLPAVAVRLLELTSSSDSHLTDVSSVLENDPALAAKILAMAQRADRGARLGKAGIRHAVLLLGFHAVRNAILSAYLFQAVSSMEVDEASTLNREEYWKHSVAVACAAQLLAEQESTGSARADAFVCGLLHDIGKLALDATMPKSYSRVLEAVRERGVCILDAEHEILGLDHTVAGKRLAHLWKLPHAVCESIWLHHQSPDDLPASLVSPKVVEIVHLADQLVRHERIGFSGCSQPDPLIGPADRLGIDDGGLERVRLALPTEIERVADLVDLAGLTASSLQAGAMASAARELARLNTTLNESNRHLQQRSACLDVLHKFAGRLGAGDTVAEVCLEAAKAVGQSLEVSHVAVFCYNRQGTLCYAGFHGPQGDDLRVWPLVVEPQALRSMQPTWTTPGPFAEPILRSWGSVITQGQLYFLPAIHSGRAVGGILVTAPQGASPGSLVGDEAPWDAVAASFGLGMAQSLTGGEADKLHEELADVNRRLHAAQEQLVRTRSLGMIAQMAAGAAHELNNPLAVISGRAQLLLSGQTLTDEQSRTVDVIQEQAHQCSQIVSELMAFAKPASPQAAVFSLGSALELLRSAWLARLGLESDQIIIQLDDEAISVFADVAQFNDVLDAMVNNAVEAQEAETPIRITINSHSQRSDDTVVVVIEDTGRGMTPEVMGHALDPFYSHRQAGRGRGLGLSRACRLIENNDGELSLESAPGKGTRVTIRLPARSKAADQA